MKAKHLFTVIALVLSGWACMMAQEVTFDKITYKIENGEAYVYKADKDIKVANILSSVEHKGKSYPVTRISRPYKQKSTTNLDKWFGGYGFCMCKL